ncbi:hypothetical protein DACRYDRAFT_23497 [Dacryopinax primogenitus]|uniref:MARVEL domain-containing protein n=1 Tax=Dacryopinax primogenitus (strain DJM 731) TaxID=1858805 RepID=M5FUN2_DACPD|nr:uncharacterized protein DACRYDRAFT_23497 [Dacryopinax primogenitus]EJT99963.1 hypothetical protein DACRYDRAFT_23497 [Dacryopinax primogenitus]
MYTFCCCLPVRFGAFALSAVTAVASIMISIGMFIAFKKQGPGIPAAEKAVLIIAGILWLLLFLFSVFGFIGTLSARRTFVLVYSRMLWIHWFVSTFVGSILIWNLSRKSFHTKYLAQCEAEDPKHNTAAVCEKSLQIGRGIYIAVFVVFQLISLYGCIIVSRYVKQLQEEQDHKAIRKMENTLANMSYAYTNQANSFGNTPATANPTRK